MGIALTGFSQTDTTKNPTDITAKTTGTADTIKVGGMIIVRTPGEDGDNKLKNIQISNNKRKKNTNVTTNWWIVDLGFSNWNDNTLYGSPSAQDFAPGLTEDHFDLRSGKSVNVNIWMFMQKVNLVKHVVNLKYGVGLEMFNFRYKRNILYDIDPTEVNLDDTRNYEKNKLAVEYVTAPIMLNFNFTPDRKRGFGFSAGISAGYLLWSRQKTVTSEDGKQKTKDDFDLRPFKISYIGELTLGPVKLYGSYALKSMFEKGLDQQPYAVGFRLSNW